MQILQLSKSNLITCLCEKKLIQLESKKKENSKTIERSLKIFFKSDIAIDKQKNEKHMAFVFIKLIGNN